MSSGLRGSSATPATPPTGAAAYVGAYAAALVAAEVSRLPAQVASPACEVFVDLASRRMLSSELTRNPHCRFDHECWHWEETADVALRELLLSMDAVAAAVTLAVAGDAFVEVLRCACGTPRRFEFLLAGRVGGARGDGCEQDWRCPSCGAAPVVTGFDRRERIALSRLSPATTCKTLGELGVRSGDVLDFDLGARGHRRFVLRTCANGNERRAARRVVVVGCGNIGSHAVALFARDPALAALVVVDPDNYDAGNVATQNLAGAADVGRNKALVQAEYARRIRPDFEVEVHPVALEALPWSVFADAVVVGALDSRLARMRLQERAWRMGSVFVDAGVAGAARQVRISIYPPGGPGTACHECAWTDEDYAAVESLYPCAEGAGDGAAGAQNQQAASNLTGTECR